MEVVGRVPVPLSKADGPGCESPAPGVFLRRVDCRPQLPGSPADVLASGRGYPDWVSVCFWLRTGWRPSRAGRRRHVGDRLLQGVESLG
jgi:hypothetical protein